MNLIDRRTFYFWNAVITTFALTFLIWLIYFRPGSVEGGANVALLPLINALLNSTCAVLLILGFRAIKRKQENLHRVLMITAFCVSALFLVSYVYYHSIQGDTKFLGEGWIRPVYFAILITHILFSMIMLPMILSSIFFGLTDKRKSHKKIAKITLPIWLYVSVTGVIIFVMLKYYS